MTFARTIPLSITALAVVMAAITAQPQMDERQPPRPAETDAPAPEPARYPRSESSPAPAAEASTVAANYRPCQHSERRTDDCPP